MPARSQSADATPSAAPATDSPSCRLSGTLVAGIDVGTTAVKAVVADEDGRVVGRARVASRLAIGAGGNLEHDAPASWWEAPRSVLRQALGAGRPRAVAVSAMMPSVTAVGPGGRPLGPGLLYGDGRPAPSPAGVTGDPTASDEMARLCAWVAAHHPGAEGYWPAQAVANASLGGEGVTDLASAFAAGPLFGGSGWDEATCQASGFPATCLPRVAVFGEAIGSLVPGVLDVEDAAGDDDDDVVLGAGSVDGMCEQLVAGTVQAGDVLIALGSTLVVWLTVPGWPDEVPGLWRAPHLAPGMAMLGGASNAGGTWADWVDRVVRPTPAGPGPEGAGPEGAGPEGAGREGAGDVPIWWPWARGERVPWHDRALRVGLAGADISHGPEALRRGAYEATGFVARYIVERAATCGTRPGRFVASGGGTLNQAWLQAVADVLGQPVLPMAVPEGAALGAAWLARMAAGLETSVSDGQRWARWSAPVEPRRQWAEAAAERYQAWRQGLPAAT
jgi:xylulokinase